MQRQLHEPRLRRRSRVLLVVVTGWMFVVIGRLAHLQIVQHEAMLKLARRQQQHLIRVSPLRGVIYDRLGRELARSVEVESVFAVPGEATLTSAMVVKLAQALNLKLQSLQEKLAEPREFVWLKRKVAEAEAQAVKALRLPGIYFIRESKRYYPNGVLAAHVLGYTGMDGIGLDGVERVYDEYLRGQESYVRVQRDARGRSYGYTLPPLYRGQDLTLTIDVAIQMVTEEALREAVEQARARSGVAIVMQPKTGEILALANIPTFDPNTFSTSSEHQRRNRAICDLYEPGSVFKIVTYAAALEEHRTRPDEMVDCLGGQIRLAGHSIRDHKAFGLLSVREALEHSSNVGAIRLALSVGSELLARYIQKFGFGRPTGVDLSGEAAGLVRPVQKWSEVSIGAVAIGQEVGVTAIQMVAAMAAIANDGVWVQPHLVRAIHSRAGDVPSRFTPQQRPVISRRTARTLTEMLQGVVLRGTGKRAHLNGYTAAGKTGTAQQFDPESGRYSPTRYIASFVGFAPVKEPQVCILVAIDEPRGLYHGGDVAAPVFKRIAEMVLHYLNVPPDAVSPSLEVVTLAEAVTSEGTSGVSEKPLMDHAAPAEASSEEFQSNRLWTSSAVLPDFSGRGIRSVAQECARLGIRLVAVGSGQAVRQQPAPGTPITPGLTCRVEFQRQR